MSKELTGMMTQDEFLEHAGVKGMKWGRRKSDSRSTSTSADAARVNRLKERVKKNGPDNLSNDDLAKLNKRNQLMSEYRKNNPNLMRKSYKATKDAVAVVGTLTAAAAIIRKVATNETVQNVVKTAVQKVRDL